MCKGAWWEGRTSGDGYHLNTGIIAIWDSFLCFVTL